MPFRRSPSPESHRLWNNRRDLWFHPACRIVQPPHRRALALGGIGLYPGSACRAFRGDLVRSASDPVKKLPKTKGGMDGRRTGKAVGDALRNAYDEAVSEAIPEELLDLLKKLD